MNIKFGIHSTLFIALDPKHGKHLNANQKTLVIFEGDPKMS